MVLSMSWSNPLQVGDVTTNLFDGLNLFSEVVGLKEVRHLHGRGGRTRRERKGGREGRMRKERKGGRDRKCVCIRERERS